MRGIVINLENERILRSYDRIGKAIVDYIRDMDLVWEIEMARRIYFGKYLNLLKHGSPCLNYKPFIQWLIFSYKLYSSGCSLIDSISKSNIGNMNSFEKDTIHKLKNTYESFYKIYSVHKDKIIAKDIFSGETVVISDNPIRYSVKRYYGIFTRIANIRDKNIPLPGYRIMPNAFLKEAEKFVMGKYEDSRKFNKNISIRDFINSNSLMIHRYLLRYLI